MKLTHVLCALQSPKHASKVVNGLEDMIWKLTILYPSTPQNSSASGDGAVVDEVEVMDEIKIEDAEEALDNDVLNEVLVNVELISVDIVVEIEVVLLELRLLELEVLRLDGLARLEVLLESDETAPHLPNPGWQPVPQYALELPQYEC
jgi:hypothetical protein